ncbi:hypothetical protein U1707_18520 [Sphingomonas sp. PB2P12]|uniref:hypothetical protein n=1 Tax=Sphingomonas sandaracina TaxID=3096157 RepID=UPI002FCB269D
MRSLGCLGALLLTAQAAPPSGVVLGDIEVRLFYKETGRLSEDILSRKRDFVFHNTIIGEGDAVEAADDLLVSVVLSSGKFGKPEDNQKGVQSPVELVARGANGKLLGRRVHPSVLTSFGGTETKTLWLNDVTCSGEITITATFAGQTKSTRFVMGCGE